LALPGYRQVAVRLNHVTLAVGDVEGSVRSYTRLGLTQIVAVNQTGENRLDPLWRLSP
jgi:catechol 2,3-dioxygenase-like lactoylglutathione lyase family enzyme